MTAQCRWLNTVQSAQSGCPAGIWFPIKFPKTSPAWIALRSQSARSDAVRIFVSRQDAVSLRCHGSAGYGKPAAHRFSSPQVRLPQTAAVFSVTVIPLFRRPDGRGCLYRPAVFVSKPITPHKLSVSFGSSVPCGGTMAVWLHLHPSIPLLLLS